MIENKVKKAFEQCGIIVLDDEKEIALEIDSLQMISLIVQLEDTFNIMLDDLLLDVSEVSFNSVCKKIESIVNSAI